MNSLRIMGPKQIKAEHLVAMAVHMEWLATLLSPPSSNIFTLFMKYFISSIANAKYKSQGDAVCLSSWSCGMPVPVLHGFFFGKGWVFVHKTHCFLIPSSSYSSISSKKKKKEKKRQKETSVPFFFTLADRNHEQKRQFDLLMWEIRFPSEIYPLHWILEGEKRKKTTTYHMEKVTGIRNKKWNVYTVYILCYE